MDKIESLIKALLEAKEELSKNMNCSYEDEQNMVKSDITKMPIEHLKQKTEEVQQKVKARHGDTLKLDGAHHKNWNRKDHEYFLSNYAHQHGVSIEPSSEKKETPKPKTILRPGLKKNEELEKDAANPALAPKQVKVKQLQAQIDAGTYKPDPKKIADKMLKEELMCSANGQWKIMEKAEASVHIDPSHHQEHDDGGTSHYSGHIHVDGQKVHVNGTDRDSNTSHKDHIVNHVSKKLGIHPDKVKDSYHVIHYAITDGKKPFTVHKNTGKGESISVK